MKQTIYNVPAVNQKTIEQEFNRNSSENVAQSTVASGARVVCGKAVSRNRKKRDVLAN